MGNEHAACCMCMKNMGVSVAGRGVAWSVEIGEWRLVLCVVCFVFCLLCIETETEKETNVILK